MRLPRLGDRPAHLDEFVRDAPIDLQVHRHPCGAQAVGIGHALVHQRVAFGQAHPGGGDTVQIGRQQGSEAPVLPILRVFDVLAEEPVDGLGIQHQAMGEATVRFRVLVRRRARVEEQLQRQRQAGIARQDGVHRRQRAARAVAAHGQPGRVGAQFSRVRGQPGQCIPGVVRCSRKAVLGRQAVIERHHHAAGQASQFAAQHVVGLHAAHGEAATMQVEQQRQAGGAGIALGGRGVEPRRQHRPAARGNAQLLHAGQRGLGHFQHAGAGLVGGAGTHRAQGVQRRAAGACHAVEHVGHLRGQGSGGRGHGRRMEKAAGVR